MATLHRLRLALVSVTCAWVASCEGDPREPDGSTRAVFAPAVQAGPPTYGEAPFPSDAYLGVDGRFEGLPGLSLVAPDTAVSLEPHIRTLGGVSTRPVVEVFLDGPLDPAHVPSRVDGLDDAVVLLDDAGTPQPVDVRYDPEYARLAVSPVLGHPLEPGSHYTLVVTRALRAPDGPLARDPDFDALLEASADDAPARWSSTRAAFDAAVDAGIAGRDVVALARFRVDRHRDVLLAARAAMDTRPAPSVRFEDPSVIFVGASALDAVLGPATRDAQDVELPGWDNPTGIAHAHVAALGSGVIETIRFRRADASGAAGYATSSGTIELDATGAPVVADPAYPIRISVAIPEGPVPTAGFPVMLYGHGLSATRHQMLMMMETAAAAGFAVVAIDASSHGSRYRDVDTSNNLARLLPSFGGDALLPDGFGDIEGFASALQLFHGFVNVPAFRDEMRQTVLDWSQVVRWIRGGNADLSAFAAPAAEAPRLDPARIVYFGESYGGVIGGMFVSIEPHLRGAVLNVPGGGFVDLCGANSPVLGNLVSLGLAGTHGATGRFDRFHPLIGLANAFLDGADPLVFAPLALHRSSLGPLEGSARDVLLFESIGDETMANVGTEALAQAMGVELLGPSFADIPGMTTRPGTVSGNVGGRTGLLVQFAPATHGENWSKTSAVRTVEPFFGETSSWTFLPEPITIRNPVRETRAFLDGVLAQMRDGQVLTVAHPAPPVRDFDDDGILDELDATPFVPGP